MTTLGAHLTVVVGLQIHTTLEMAVTLLLVYKNGLHLVQLRHNRTSEKSLTRLLILAYTL